MENIRIKYPKLLFYYIVIKKSIIKLKYPGGLKKFSKDFHYQYNNNLVVLIDMGSSVGDIITNLKSLGFRNNKDYFAGIEPPVKDYDSIKNTPIWLKIEYNENDMLYVKFVPKTQMHLVR